MERNTNESKGRAVGGAADRDRMAGVEHDADRGLSGGLALGTTLLLAGLAVAFLAFGCGKQEEKTVAATAESSAAAAPSSNASVAAPSLASPKPGVMETTPSADGALVQGLHMDTVTSDALPPEVEAATPEGPVAPGSVVALTAEGSSDVVSMTLRDGRGKEQPFGYDEATGVWRTLYRAPLRAGADRVALSVTAKNGAEQWRRVWVFLSLGQEVARADSTSD